MKDFRYYKHLAEMKQYYYDNRTAILQRQSFYRYRKSVQKRIDDNWDILSKLNKDDLRTWAILNSVGTSAKGWSSYWRAIARNKAEGKQVVNSRIKKMKNFISNIGKKKARHETK